MKKRLVAFFLAVCLLCSSNAMFDFTSNAAEQIDNLENSVSNASEEDISDDQIQQEETQESQGDQKIEEDMESSGENIAQDDLKKTSEPQKLEVYQEESIEVQTEDKLTETDKLKENSWRYTDGVWTPMEENGVSLFSNDAWSFVDGHYVNNRGQIIEGAIAKGIDVSEHNGVIDWEQVKNSDVKFVIIRCGYGQDYTSQDDLYWERNVKECVRLGIPFGVYLYSYAMTPAAAKSEAERVLRLISGYKLS